MRLVRYRLVAGNDADRAVDFQHGDVAHMPFADASFDFVVCSAAFKNFPDPVAALDEIFRVLRPGGQALIIDMRKDAPPSAIADEIRGMHLNRLSSLLVGWIFRFGLLRAALTRPALEAAIGRSRFGRGQLTNVGVTFELRLDKPASPRSADVAT